MGESSQVDADHIRGVFQTYVDRMTAGDHEGVVALYADDAFIEDPVGSEPVRGRDAISKFYQASAGLLRMELEGRVRVAAGQGACAMRARPKSDDSTVIETLDVMTFAQGGLITSMRAWWSADTIFTSE